MEWKILRILPNNKLVRSSLIWLVIVPIIAKIFYQMKSTNFSNELVNEFINTISLPFTWYIFFFSALSFTIGNLVYNFTCPLIIKENRDYGDFIIQGRNFFSLYHYAIPSKELSNKLNDKLKEVQSLGIEYFASTSKQLEELKREEDIIFWEIFNQLNKSKVFFRMIISSFYVIGFLLISWVLIEKIKYVIGAI